MFNYPRRPPLAEIDSWELWQAWKRGDQALALPWLGLLASFCVVLAAMYSFFFLSISFRDDTVALVALTFVGIVFAFSLWRKISTRRSFALAVVALIIVASGLAFSLWLAFYAYTGWNPFAAILGTVLLGLAGIGIGLPSLNAIAQRQEEADRQQATEVTANEVPEASQLH